MGNRIVNLFELILRRLLPANGRHGTAEIIAEPAAKVGALDVAEPLPSVVPSPRPFLLEHGRRILEERMRQRERRRVLWLAVHGIDVDPGLVRRVRVGDPGE